MKTQKPDHSAGFSISFYSEDVIEENALESFGPKYSQPEARSMAMKAGYVDGEGNITTKGWDALNNDLVKLEKNSLTWLRRKFITARDEGHDSHGDLVGSFWFDPADPEHAYLISMGVNERIDMVDASYGDLAGNVWRGTGPFSIVLGGAIHFFDVDADDLEKIEETLDVARRRGRDPILQRRVPATRRHRTK